MAFKTVYSLATAIRVVATHPVTRHRPFRSLGLYLRENLERRLTLGPAYPYVAGMRIRWTAGVSWLGLVEFEDQGFVLHFLRPGDLFADVGAHVGSYTLLAAGACGARAVALEPSPETFRRLQANLAENGLAERVRAVNVGASSRAGTVWFAAGGSMLDHVSTTPGRGGPGAVEVPVRTVDEVLGGEVPVLMKIDVEGYEHAVLEGAWYTLGDPLLKGVIIEISGWGERYGFTDRQVHRRLLEHGFRPYSYAPLTRALRAHDAREVTPENTIYLRDEDFVRDRLATARPFDLFGRSF